MSEIKLSTQEVCGILKNYIKEQHGVEIGTINVEFDLEENKEKIWEVVVSGFKFGVKEEAHDAI